MTVFSAEMVLIRNGRCPIPDELLPQEVINAREEVQERFVNE